jgi:hypothetical protein
LQVILKYKKKIKKLIEVLNIENIFF